MRRATWAFVVLALLPATVAVAQQTGQQEDSLAAAARRAREEKKQQVQSAKVWNNDNIPKSPVSLSVIGQPAAEPASTGEDAKKTEASQAAPNADTKKTPTAAEQKAAVEADLAAAKEQLQNLQNDFDILQRKHTLDQQMYYGKPDYSSDKAGAAALQDEQDQIDAKQQEMIAAQQKVADLQAKLNAGSSDAKTNSQQQ